MRKTKLIVIFLLLVLSLSLLACTSTEASNGFYTIENGSNSFTMLLKGALVNSMGYKTLDLKEDNNQNIGDTISDKIEEIKNNNKEAFDIATIIISSVLGIALLYILFLIVRKIWRSLKR